MLQLVQQELFSNIMRTSGAGPEVTIIFDSHLCTYLGYQPSHPELSWKPGSLRMASLVGGEYNSF